MSSHQEKAQKTSSQIEVGGEHVATSTEHETSSRLDVNTQSNDTDNEQGYKWWLRYVVVPLFGGGGVIAIIVALLTRPTPTVAQEIQLLTDEGGTETADVILTRDTHLITQQDLRRLDRNKFYVDEKLETAI